MSSTVTTLNAALDDIKRSPEGPKIGAFFDYDETLIHGNSAAAYSANRQRRAPIGAEILKTLTRWRKVDGSPARSIGQWMLQWAGFTESEMRELWHRLFVTKIGPTLFPEAWKLVRAHQRRGHTVVIASSALRYQIEPLAEEYGIEHILCTRAQLRGEKLTGAAAGQPMCGAAKLAAIKAFAARRKINLAASFAYCHRHEDAAALASIGHPRAVQPDDMLELTAGEMSWPILNFERRDRGSATAMARTVGAYGAMGATFLAGMSYAKATGRTRRAVDLITSVSSDWALAVLGVDVEVVGEHYLWSNRPCVFILNHQSKFDQFLMMHLVRRDFTGVAKKEAANTPGFGAYFKMADYTFLDRSNTADAIEALQPAVDRLKKGLCVVIAPEGTRSWTPTVGRFKKGAFHIARQAGVPVVPVVIRNAGEIMGRNDQTMRSGKIQVAVLPPIQVKRWRLLELDARVSEVRQLYVDTLEAWPASAT